MNLTLKARDILRRQPGLVDELDTLLARINLLWAKEHDPLSGVHRWPDNVRQTFNPGDNQSGINVGSQEGDPDTPVDGDIWYNNVTDTLRARINGATFDLGGPGSGGNVTTAVTLTSGRLIIGAGGTSITVGDLSGDVTTSGSTVTTAKTALKTRGIGISIDGGGATITTGVKGDLYVPFACTITEVTMLADQSGSIVVDIWKDTYANYAPTVADSITASAKPTISSATKSQDTTLTGWTTSVSAGNTLRFNVDSATSIARLNLVLTVTV